MSYLYARLKDLLAALPCRASAAAHGDANPVISGVTDDSRQVQPGWLFVACRGITHDGHEFIDQAISSGAAALLCERPPGGALAIPTYTVLDSRACLGPLLARFYRIDEACRSGRLKLIGITGTNGKTTTAWLVHHVLNHTGIRCGRITTVDRDLAGPKPLPSHVTTPPATALFADIRSAIEAGCQAVVLEVSSHGLDQRRVDGLEFFAAAFTNLSGDHLDYHGTMEAYARTKARLFRHLPPHATAVVNADDPYHRLMLEGCPAKVIRYGLTADAELRARILRCGLDGLQMLVEDGSGRHPVESPLIGQHNAANILAAWGICRAFGIEPRAIAEAIGRFRCVPGRLEPVGGDLELPFRVLVDYAHTDDALQKVLTALRPLCAGRLWVVFGCGGDRDRTKRPRMGRVASHFADRIVVTSDNPRSEPPGRIIDEILKGVPDDAKDKVTVEPDRAAAINLAITSAGPGDLVLIAGKGHENYQIIGTERRPFDDRTVALEAMRKRARAAV